MGNKFKYCRINAILKEKNKTKVWLAEKCNLSKQHLGIIANGKSGLTMKTANKIAKALKMRVDEVFTS